MVTFNDGAKRIFDGHSLLDGPMFAPLADEKVFNDYALDYETLTWLNGEVDIAPEFAVEAMDGLCPGCKLEGGVW